MTFLTKPQRKAVYIKYLRSPDGTTSYREFRARILPSLDCVMLPWCGMWLGIELDGYTHS